MKLLCLEDFWNGKLYRRGCVFDINPKPLYAKFFRPLTEEETTCYEGGLKEREPRYYEIKRSPEPDDWESLFKVQG